MTIPKSLYRLSRYTAVGALTFSLDLLLLFLLTDIFGWHYLLSAGLAFLIAVSLNYVISRDFVFPGSSRPSREAYFWFLVIAATGLGIVVGLMYLLVTVFLINYIVARIAVSLVTGLWNYLLNLFFNFQVAGQYPSGANKLIEE